MLIYKRNIMSAPSREKRSQPRLSRPPCPGMVAVTILLATVRSFPPRSSRPPLPGMVAVTILVGHCAPLPANIVTPSLPGHGGCDDAWWPTCTPSRAKRNQPRFAHLSCSGMVAHCKEDNFRVGCVGCRGLCFSVSSEIRSSGPPSPQAPSQTPQRRETHLGASLLFPLRLRPPCARWSLLCPLGPPWASLGPPWASLGPALGPWALGPGATKTNDSSQKNQ